MKKTQSTKIAAALLGVTLVCSLLTSVQGQTANPQLEEAQRLEQQADQAAQAGRNDEAIGFLERALALREKAQGREAADVIEEVYGLAMLYYGKGDYQRAESLFARALAAYEKYLGADSAKVAETLSNLGLVYDQKGDFNQAELLFQRALAIWEKALGPEHPDVATALNNLANVYLSKGDYIRAESVHQRALAIREKVLGPEHPNVALSLDNLGVLYGDKGDYTRAANLHQRALAIFEKAYGPEHLDVAIALQNLATVYEDQGDYARVVPFYQRVVAIKEKVLGPEHPELALSLIGLANVYLRQGDYTRAEFTYRRSLTIFEKTLGPEHPKVALSLNGLAAVYEDQGDYARTLQFYQRALSIREKALGPEHSDVATALHSLARLYRAQGDYALALSLYQRALAIREKKLGPEHRDVARSLNGLAGLFQDQGDYTRALPLYQRALAIAEKALGPEHPIAATVLSNLATLYQAQGDFKKALDYSQRAAEVYEKNIAAALSAGSQQQKQFFLDSRSGEANAAISLHAQATPQNADAARLALTTILRRKGRTLDAFSDQLAALRQRAHPDDQKLLDELAAVQSQLANLQLGGSKLPPAALRAEIARLATDQERLEDAISRRSAEFRAVALPVTLDAVRQALPADAALIEFFVYHPFNAKAKAVAERFGAPRYIAYLLKRDSAAPLFVELGQAAALEALLKQWRAALLNPKSADVKTLGRAVDAQVMQPVRKLLGDTKRLFISPDSALNLVPFAALVDENDKFLVETYSLNYLTSGRDLLRLQIPPDQKPDAPVILANPQFDLTRPVVTCRAAQRGLGLPADEREFRGLDFTQYCYPTLDGTAQEAARLSALLPQAKTWTQKEATEATLKTLRRPSVLHIATHGFFLPDQPPPAPNAARQLSLGLDNTAAAGPLRENPLLRSGLILAGVKQRQSGPDNDGVLTALEAAGLNLFGTKLVVLSACETGLGEVANGQGVYGLRRALVLAGSETQVMSLWKVSDAATAALMTSYYTRLQRGEGRSEAMRAVQLEMLKNGKLAASGETRKIEQEGDKKEAGAQDWRHPYYWAAFIQSGAWTSLDGK